MMTPMMMVQTICDALKYGARRRLAPISTAMTDMPEKNAVAYKYVLLFSNPFSISFLLSLIHSLFVKKDGFPLLS